MEKDDKKPDLEIPSEASQVNLDDLYEMMKPYANLVFVKRAEEYKKEAVESKKENTDLKNTCSKMAIDLYKIKDENEKQAKEIEELKALSSTPLNFYPIYDPRMYENDKHEHPDGTWIRSTWDTLYAHSTYTTEDGAYYIENGTSATIIYKVMHESNNIAYRFISTYDDFSTTWNANVAFRHTDPKRQSQLTCNKDSLKAEYNKHWHKDKVSLGRLGEGTYAEGIHDRIYGKAQTIITRVMPDLKAIDKH